MNILFMSCCILLQRESGKYTTSYTNHRYLKGMSIFFNIKMRKRKMKTNNKIVNDTESNKTF